MISQRRKQSQLYLEGFAGTLKFLFYLGGQRRDAGVIDQRQNAARVHKIDVNLAILVLDNESYLETGSQPTATAGRTDLEAVARGCGIATTLTVREQGEVAALRELVCEAPGPVLAVAKVQLEALPLKLPHTLDGATAINRFRDAATAPAHSP